LGELARLLLLCGQRRRLVPPRGFEGADLAMARFARGLPYSFTFFSNRLAWRAGHAVLYEVWGQSELARVTRTGLKSTIAHVFERDRA